MATYRIKWEIEVDGDTPEKAAAEALNIQRDPDSEALFFDVTNLGTGEETQVDVLEMRFTIIKQINDIIQNFGIFSTMDVEADFSPCINNMGGVTILLEEFHEDKAYAVTYDDEIEINTDWISYSHLDTENLELILNLAKDWKEICEEDEDYISEKDIENAAKCLVYDNDDEMEEWIRAIKAQAKIDDSVVLEFIDGVEIRVWETLAFRLTCREFLDL